ncbi:response regulator transcription factor [Erythrobacteraceae bacterium CFH 75059]|uniref:response regulator n=1 Tax=Qipengyuania thermophila TaxID=2509361 RepID=UPI00101FD864|nr:response regulator transcription factor [Qipengyuania thermophila]TCD06672.1 response regulator transcription factor [Erythrobacteraceae bacterium CFH 75059]
MTGQPPIRVLITDDHQLAREGLAAVLSDSCIAVVGLAATGEEAVAMTRTLVPDVVLMDIRLGEGMDGLEATRQIAELDVPSRVLMLTLHDLPAYVREALAAGAAGYVLKDTGLDELRAAIRQVAEGRLAVPLGLVGAAMRAPPAAAAVRAPADMLTPRELDVTGLIARGMTNKQIARSLGISPATVKAHVERIIAKLGAADRTEAAVLAARHAPGG